MWAIVERVAGMFAWLSGRTPTQAAWEGLVARLTTRIDEQAAEHTAEMKSHREFTNRKVKELETENEKCRRERSDDLALIFELRGEVGELQLSVEILRRSEMIRSDPDFQRRTAEQNQRLLGSPDKDHPT